MRQQLRLQVLLPVAVLALLGVGYGAFAYGTPPAAETSALEVPLAPRHEQVAKKPAKKAAAKTKANVNAQQKAVEPAPAPAPARTPLERELAAHSVVVVVFYSPEVAVDGLAVREARAGAAAVEAGFLAVDVTRNGAVAKLATEYEVRESPAVLVFVRGPRATARFGGYADRETVAQAVQNARL